VTEGRDFTPEESKKIEELHELREELFSEIALIIASRLGYSTDKVEDLAKLRTKSAPHLWPIRKKLSKTGTMRMLKAF
jgi:hypothetical protein